MKFIRKHWNYALALAALTLVSVTATATLAAAAPTPKHSANVPSGVKPTIVIVHGAFADASGWNGVIGGLLADGYPVIAPADPLRSLTSDSAYIRSVLDSITGPIVLVGHSYGGAIITNAAAGDPNVKALVFVAAFVPDVGEQLSTLLTKFPGSEAPAALKQVPFTGPGGTTGTDLYLQASQFRAVFAADLPTWQTQLMAAEQRPMTTECLSDPTTAAAWHTIPSWGVVAGADKVIPPALEKWEYQRANSHITVVPGASHVVFISHPAVVQKIIEEAAAATS